MKEYVINLKTNIDLGSEDFVAPLLTEWTKSLEPTLRPDRFDLGEPVRRDLEKEGVGVAIQTWVNARMPLYLKRVKNPKFMTAISWRANKGLDKKLFPWGCSVWLSVSAGDERAVALMKFLVSHFKPAFAFLTSYEDERMKHFVSVQDKGTRIEKYMGLDLGKTLPGIYWKTFFGQWAKDKVGVENIKKLKAQHVEAFCGGSLISAYSSCAEAGSESARKTELEIIHQLGSEHFFDKNSVNVETIKMPLDTVKLVEQKIADLKK